MTTPPTRSDAVETLLGTSFGRRQLSRSSVAFFDTHYCGMEPVEHRKRWLNKMYSARARAKRLARQEKILLLAPRKHGKSESIISISAQFICEARAIRILLVGSTFGQASKRLRRVKKLLENKKVIKDWCCGSRNEGLGPFRDKTSKWGDHVIEVVRPEDADDHIDPTMEAVGIGGAITGGHFDVIILDDVESKKRVKNSRIRRETKEWYEEVLLPMLEPDGLLIVIGTRKHRDDLYSFMMPEVAGFDVIHDRAIVQEPDSIEPVFELVDGRKKLIDVKFTGGRALWPRSDIGPVSQRRGLKWVLMVQLTYRDQRLFTREWQNVVLDHEDRMFQASWINAGVELGAKVSLYTGLSPRPDPFPPPNGSYGIRWPDLVVAQAWDLSLIMDEREAEEKDSDFAVGITAGWEPETDRNWLMGICRVRGKDPDEIQDLIVRERLLFPQYDPRREGVPFVRAIAVEKNSFGAIHTWGMRKRNTPYGKLPIVPHTTHGGNKADPWVGLPAMQYTWKTQGVVVPSATQQDLVDTLALRNEFADFGVARHDDCVLAFWIWECVMRVVKAEWIRANRKRKARTSIAKKRARSGGQES